MHQLFQISFEAGPEMDRKTLGKLLDRLPPRRVHHIYLRHRINFLGSSPDHDSINAMLPLVRVISAAGVKPVLLLEYTCMGDHHLTVNFQKNLGITLKCLDESGLEGVMVSDLYLARLFCNPNPPYGNLSNFQLFISNNARINKAVKACYLDNLHFVSLTAHHDLLTDIEQLSRLGRAISPARLEIPLNRGCVAFCPVEIFCRAGEFHREQEENLNDTYYGKLLKRWLSKKGTAPVEAPTVRPSETGPYIDAGVSGFRLYNDPVSTSGLEELIRAYLNRKDPEDLSILEYNRCPGLKTRQGD